MRNHPQPARPHPPWRRLSMAVPSSSPDASTHGQSNRKPPPITQRRNPPTPPQISPTRRHHRRLRRHRHHPDHRRRRRPLAVDAPGENSPTSPRDFRRRASSARTGRCGQHPVSRSIVIFPLPQPVIVCGRLHPPGRRRMLMQPLSSRCVIHETTRLQPTRDAAAPEHLKPVSTPSLRHHAFVGQLTIVAKTDP